MLNIYISEHFADGARRYDVAVTDQTRDVIVLHATTRNAAIALAYALARSIDQHATNPVRVIRAAA